jgi:hypothetical protein
VDWLGFAGFAVYANTMCREAHVTNSRRKIVFQ